MIEIEINVNKKDLRELKKMPTQYKKAAERGFTKAVLFLEGKAKKEFTKKRVPAGPLHVITGNLRRSIIGKAVGFTGYLGATANYAATHEYGDKLRHIPKRPFIMPVIEDYKPEISNIIEKEIIEELNK